MFRRQTDVLWITCAVWDSSRQQRSIHIRAAWSVGTSNDSLSRRYEFNPASCKSWWIILRNPPMAAATVRKLVLRFISTVFNTFYSNLKVRVTRETPSLCLLTRNNSYSRKLRCELVSIRWSGASLCVVPLKFSLSNSECTTAIEMETVLINFTDCNYNFFIPIYAFGGINGLKLFLILQRL